MVISLLGHDKENFKKTMHSFREKVGLENNSNSNAHDELTEILKRRSLA